MREVRFHIHRKSTFAGALLPYRMHINGQYIGTIRNGKSLDANVPKAGVYYIEDDILSSRNAVIYDNGLSEYSVVIKRAGGWRTESYNEFYIEMVTSWSNCRLSTGKSSLNCSNLCLRVKGCLPLAWSFGCPPWTICRRSLLQNIFWKS